MRLSAIVRLLSAAAWARSRKRGQAAVSGIPPRPRALRSRAGHHEGVAVHAERQAAQAIAHARPGRAEPGRGLVDRAVGRTDQGAAVLGEEIVRPEVERRADVRAPIEVGVIAAVEVDDEPAHAAPAALETERRGAAWRHP